MNKCGDGRSSIRRRAGGTGWGAWGRLGGDAATGERRREDSSAATGSAAAAKVAALEAQRDGGVAPSGWDATFADWLDRWVRFRSRVVRPKVLPGYGPDVKHVAAAGIGGVRLRALTAWHVGRLYTRVLDAGCMPGRVAHVRRTVAPRWNAAACCTVGCCRPTCRAVRSRRSTRTAPTRSAPCWPPPAGAATASGGPSR